MAVWQVALFSKWETVNGGNQMAIITDHPAEWTDITSQEEGVISARSAQYGVMALGKIDDATLAAINADSHYLILARYELDVPVPSFDNRQSNVTAGQRTAFINYFLTEFGIDVSKIPVIANSVGKSRLSVIRNIVQDMRNLR